jgi:hypothetical protein
MNLGVEEQGCSKALSFLNFADLLLSSTARASMASLLSGLEGERNLSQERRKLFLNWVGINRDSIIGTGKHNGSCIMASVSRFPILTSLMGYQAVDRFNPVNPVSRV